MCTESSLISLILVVFLFIFSYSIITCFQSHRELGPDECYATIYTYGSYRLGVYGPKDDIDALIVGAEGIDRHEDFFGKLVSRLQSETGITSLIVCY